MEFTIGEYTIKFPYDPYVVQTILMKKVIQAAKNKQNALLESPTGIWVLLWI